MLPVSVNFVKILKEYNIVNKIKYFPYYIICYLRKKKTIKILMKKKTKIEIDIQGDSDSQVRLLGGN